MNMRSGSNRYEKCPWYEAVDEFMSDWAHIITHVHANAIDPDGPKSAMPLDTNTTDFKSNKSSSTSSKPNAKPEMFLERFINEITKSSKSLMDSLMTFNEMKMSLLISMQQTMQKLVEKF